MACKAENGVPVGRFRTWVKYTEQGRFPEVRRHFAVLRCNHCDDAPCVRICPVRALEKRADGIVDIDRDACIGCRACMQACPYDAIYLNEDRGAVEKCHYCAHRVERGLEPACVIVCPEGAIVSGDLDDAGSRIAQMVASHATLVRRPEQGTGPNVHYKGVLPESLEPGVAERPKTYIWSDRPPEKPERWPVSLPVLPDTRTVLDAGHAVEWGWPVALYLVTKGVAAGAGILAPFAGALGLSGAAGAYVPEIIALAFTLLTVVLLVEDLTRPWAFYRMLTRPNWRSWLVRGGVVLALFGASSAGALGFRILGLSGVADGIRWCESLLGLAAAGYTAFLFAQCEGRDLWQSRWLLPHLIAQALLCGGVALLPFSTAPLSLKFLVAGCALVHLSIALHEWTARHATSNARQGAAFLGTVTVAGLRPYRDGLLLGVVVPIVVLAVFPGVAVFIPALAGLYLYEWAYVRAGQLPPLS